MAQKGRGIFMVYVDIDAQHVQEFNEWYNKEHLPELLSVPGILSAARYEAVRCRRDLCWNLIGAVSDWMRIRGQAARSIGLSASFWVRLCHPSTLRIVI